tara:strand:+ start:5093 stop:5659 length:567 start_codon:yes stop_codon:yes gene_type:complete
MKYAITGPKGLIFKIVEELPRNTRRSVEISDADAAIVEASDDIFYIIDDVLISRTDIEADLQRAKDIAVLEALESDLNKAKSVVRQRIAEQRYNFEVGGIEVDGLHVRTDRFTVERIYQARVLAKENAEFITAWKLSDDSFITLNADSIINIADSITTHITLSFYKEMDLNSLVDTATTVSELTSINW